MSTSVSPSEAKAALETDIYEVAIIGGGASGSALLYTLVEYTNIQRLVLLEKYAQPGQVNSNAKNNSQTLHVGDIETNYSMEKVAQVKPAAMMLVAYAERLRQANLPADFLSDVQKMVLAVGQDEVEALRDRYTRLKPLFPELEWLGRDQLAKVEPAVVEGRNVDETVAAMFNPKGYAVDFATLARSFIDHARAKEQKRVDTFFESEVTSIKKEANGLFRLTRAQGDVLARAVIVDADAYSLKFAKEMGYGQEFSLIPIAGTFYFSKGLLKGKVYTMQEPKLPFAAVHGDPDVHVNDATRWGPTARFFPVLESRKLSTMADYFRSAGLFRLKTWTSFAKILLEPIRFIYLLRNISYELPFIGTKLFVKTVQKIVPTIRASDLRRAKGYGGMRLQRVDIRTSELLLGEGKIIGDKIIFNMAPSPGASVSLYNGMRDAKTVVSFLGEGYVFEAERMQAELITSCKLDKVDDVSLKQAYSS